MDNTQIHFDDQFADIIFASYY